MTINDLRFDVLQTFVDTVEGVSQPLQLPLLRFLRLKQSQAEDVAQVETDAGVLVTVAAGAEEAAKFPLQAAISHTNKTSMMNGKCFDHDASTSHPSRSEKSNPS